MNTIFNNVSNQTLDPLNLLSVSDLDGINAFIL